MVTNPAGLWYSQFSQVRVSQPVDPRKAKSERSRLMRLCRIQLLTTIGLSRLALPFGDKQIQMTWVVGSICFLVIALQTGFAVSGRRLAAMTGIAAVTVFETLYYHDAFSPLSLLYLFGIYVPLCLTMPALDSNSLREIWKSFVHLTAFLAVCGLIQVAVELVSHGYFLDPLSLLPEQFQLAGYETLYKTSVGPFSYVKPNGMFALEPSFFSQFIALGLVAELQYFRRKNIVVLLAAALLVSFAGTGLLVLLVALPFTKQSPKWVALAIAVGLVWSVAVGDKVKDFYSQRLEEINKPGQSGNARFVAPYQVMWEKWNESKEVMAVGIGAGQSSLLGNQREANLAPVAKVGLEFGLLGLVVFCFFWSGMYFNLALPACILAALWAFYFVASGAFLHPPTVFPIWILTLGFMPANQVAKRR